MFEQIFKAPHTLMRHRQGPLADERTRYLAQLMEGGASRSTLRHAAMFLLGFAARIDMTGDQKVSPEQIDRAADDWARRKKPSETRPTESDDSRERFRSVARAGLRFLGRWQAPKLPPHAHADLIADFAVSMRQERGLAEGSVMVAAAFV